MSLNPSNLNAAGANPSRTMLPNLARDKDCSNEEKNKVDRIVYYELMDAGIEPQFYETLRGYQSEVPTAYRADLCMWGFRRAWYYWVAEGPGIPADKAEEFHKTWGTQCRVNGHCGCPSPLDQNHGFAIGMYHIDTLEGLKAFAELLRSIYIPTPDEENP